MRVGFVIAASTRDEIANFLAALLLVYTIVIIAWVVASLVFSLGGRVPYSRPLNAVLDFLRDCTEPYLRVFRRLPLRVGPLDLTPMVAIIALQVVGSIIIAAIRPG
jgi:YggT family protein